MQYTQRAGDSPVAEFGTRPATAKGLRPRSLPRKPRSSPPSYSTPVLGQALTAQQAARRSVAIAGEEGAQARRACARSPVWSRAADPQSLLESRREHRADAADDRRCHRSW